MAPFQDSFNRIAGQLKGLTPTHRLLIGSLMVILVMALFIVAVYTGRSSMAALPVQLSGEARTATLAYLDQRNIEWVEQGGQIRVPVEQRHVVLAELTDNDIISPSAINFDALIQQDSPFLSKAQNDRRWLVATMNHLSRTISRMKGVDRADVVIDEPSRPAGIGRAHLSPSASVTVVMARGTIKRSQVDAIAEMVAGAHAELKAEHVAVIDANAGAVFHASTDHQRDASQYLELQKSTTAEYEDKLSRLLAYITGVNIAVNVIVDHRQVREESRRFDDPKQGLTRESTRNVASTNRPAGGEPGVRSNTGVSLTASAQTSTFNDERSDTRMVPVFGNSNSTSLDPGGYALKINASIGVPRSYFVQQYALEQGDAAADPTPQELDPFVQREIDRIRASVAPLVDTGPKGGSPGTVAVSMIPDVAPVMEEAALGVSGSLVGAPLTKYVALGALALVSLGAMLMMVRRASVRPEMPTAEELLGVPPALHTAESVAGEADVDIPPMEGVEIDEQTLQRRQMVEEINSLASQSPEETARLLRKWLKTAG